METKESTIKLNIKDYIKYGFSIEMIISVSF